jgi:hypothetical protein
MSADTSTPADGRGRPDRPRAAGRQDSSAWPLDDAAAAGFRGGLIGIETAARAPALVAALVLSSTPHYDAVRWARAHPCAFPGTEPLAARFPHARVAVIDGGMVPLMLQRPAEVAEVISEFLP